MTFLIDLLYRFRKPLLVIYALTVVTLYLIQTTSLGLETYILGIRKDHIYHSLMFMPLATLMFDRKQTPLVLIAVIVAPMVEFIHYFVPWRSFSVWDMVANSTGAAIGILCRAVLVRLK